jgi:23S rRNA (guanine745-N1)-methyltransferase
MLAEVVRCLACPYCGSDLSEVDGALRCAGGHAFDLSRHGYATLLPRGVRPGAEAGDDAGMVAARADFLAAGHYAPVADGIVAALAGAPPGPLVDVGAGTGQHLAAVLDAEPARVGVAIDVSRYAARRAARAHPRAGAVVADAWRALPVRGGAAAGVLDVFAPRNGAETARVLRPGGLLVVVTPADDHLGELVGALGLLTVDVRKEARLAAALEPHLEPAGRDERRWTLRLDRSAALAAVAMGPSARHLTSAELAGRIAAVPDPVEVTAAVDVRTYRRG